MNYGKKASRQRQCDALGNVLLRKFGSCIHVDVTSTPTLTVLQILFRNVWRNTTKSFKVLTWPLNSPDLNLMEHLLGGFNVVADHVKADTLLTAGVTHRLHTALNTVL